MKGIEGYLLTIFELNHVFHATLQYAFHDDIVTRVSRQLSTSIEYSLQQILQVTSILTDKMHVRM
jgi:hypothetical protein